MRAPLLGKRVVLRSLHPNDAMDVFSYASDPEVTHFVGWCPHLTPLESLTYIRRCLEPSSEFFTFAVEHRELRRVIGAVDLRVTSRLRRVGEIGYTIARPFWGRGYNVEAGGLLLDFSFREIGLRRVVAVCDVENRRSYRTMEKLGMTREGVHKGRRETERSEPDRYQYSILRQEWLRLGTPAYAPAVKAQGEPHPAA